METTIQSTATYTQTQQKVKTKTNIWENLEFNRFGVIAFVLSIVACTSGIVAGLFADGDNQFQLTLILVPTMATLVTILVVAPIKWILGVGVFAMLVNLLMIFL